MRVAVIDHRFPTLDPERAVLGDVPAEIIDLRGSSEAEAMQGAEAADGILVGPRFPLDRAHLDGLSRCRVIARYGVGVDNIDVEAATERDIAVACVPDYAVEEVSTHAIALLLALHRRLVRFDRAVREGSWRADAAGEIPRLSECTLGIVGYGRIGAETARKARAFGMRLLVSDPYADGAAIRAAGATPASYEELLGESDMISLHVPLMPQTRHIVDRAALARMRPGAVLVNVSRGGLVDDDALAEALSAGRLAGAGLDMTEVEPPPASAAILQAPNVLVTPHVAWVSTGAREELQRRAAEEVARVLRGEDAENRVN